MAKLPIVGMASWHGYGRKWGGWGRGVCPGLKAVNY